MSTHLIQVPARRATYSDSTQLLASGFNRKTTTEHKDVRIHITQTCKPRLILYHINENRGWTIHDSA